MPPPLRVAAGLGIGYRPIAETDLPFLERVYASTSMEELAQTGWPEAMVLQLLPQQFALQHRHNMEHYLTAESVVTEPAGTPVGRLYIDEWESEIRIVDIALLPQARGGGIGARYLPMCGRRRSGWQARHHPCRAEQSGDDALPPARPR